MCYFREITEDDIEVICSWCNGSGEGLYDGTTCRNCNGKGVEYEDQEEE